jgi:hypothetical protein
MEDKRKIEIWFMDNTSFKYSFEPEGGDMKEVMHRVSNALDADKLVLESKGDLFVIPISNIKYIQVSPAPEHLPEGIFRNVNITKIV